MQVGEYRIWGLSEYKNLLIEVTYCEQVKFMMHAFGDVEKPSNDTVELVCNIMQGQMILLMKNCVEVMKHTGEKEISHEHVLFLMRRNKVMLKRLLHFLYIQDSEEYLLPGFKEYLGNEHLPVGAGRVNTCIEFLSSIEKFTGDLQFLLNDKSCIDHIFQMRLERRDFMASGRTSVDQYKYFEDALRVSLYNCSKPGEFMSWLKDNSGFSYDIQYFALSIIEFLAIETVAGLVEKALCRRSEFKSYETDEIGLIPHLKLKRPIKQLNDFNDEMDCYPSEDRFIRQDSETSPSFVKFIGSPFSTSLPVIKNKPEDPSKDDFIDSIQYHHPSLFIPSERKFKPQLLSENPLTPHEIRAAFMHYQRPNPITLLMKTKIPHEVKKKINLICLAFPEEEFDEIWKS